MYLHVSSSWRGIETQKKTAKEIAELKAAHEICPLEVFDETGSASCISALSAALVGWDFAQLCPQGEGRSFAVPGCPMGRRKARRSQDQSGTETAHKALGGWSSAGLGSFCKS